MATEDYGLRASYRDELERLARRIFRLFITEDADEDGDKRQRAGERVRAEWSPLPGELREEIKDDLIYLAEILN